LKNNDMALLMNSEERASANTYNVMHEMLCIHAYTVQFTHGVAGSGGHGRG
jgi:hypothetical protein